MSQYTQLQPTKKSFLGERFMKRDGSVAGDLRCRLCGRWFSWSVFHKKKYATENRWDFQRDEPKHCGSTHCFDYEARYQRHMAKMANDPSYNQEMSYKVFNRKLKEEQTDAFQLFGKLKARGVVA